MSGNSERPKSVNIPLEELELLRAIEKYFMENVVEKFLELFRPDPILLDIGAVMARNEWEQ